MKKILYSLSLLCLILTTSCTQELQIDDSALEPGTITLTLQSVDAQTKATQAGETAYNENLIKSVHYFFYPRTVLIPTLKKNQQKEARSQILKSRISILSLSTPARTRLRTFSSSTRIMTVTYTLLSICLQTSILTGFLTTSYRH